MSETQNQNSSTFDDSYLMTLMMTITMFQMNRVIAVRHLKKVNKILLTKKIIARVMVK